MQFSFCTKVHTYVTVSGNCGKVPFFRKSSMNLCGLRKTHKWISVEEHSKVYQLLLSYIPARINKNQESAESYTIQVLPAQNKDKKDDLNESGTTFGRIALHRTWCFSL